MSDLNESEGPCVFQILTSILVAHKVDDGHPLEARGAMVSIWVNQSQVSIGITAEETNGEV